MNFNFFILENSFLILFAGIIIFLLGLVYIYRRKYNFTYKILQKSIKKNEEINSFIKLFSDAIDNIVHFEGIYETISIHIADIIDAEGICIYEKRDDDYLYAVGFNDYFPPLKETGSFVLTKQRFPSDALKHEKINVGECIVGEVVANRTGLLIPNAQNDIRLNFARKIVPIKNLIAIPMFSKNDVIGAICAINSKTKTSFSREQYRSLESMSQLVVLVHNIIKTYYGISKQERILQELEFAKLLQSSLLPKNNPEWDPFVIHGFTRSAKEVSGDFYDYIEIDKDRLLVVMGDASGKGIPACMIMFMTRSFIRASADKFTNLVDMLDDLNTNLYRDTGAGRFVTLSCCLLDKKNNIVEFARAGHTKLLIYSSKHKVRRIHPKGTALGLMPRGIAGEYDSLKFTFKPYYSMIMYSDGIIEAVNKDGAEFGQEQLEGIFYESCNRKDSPSKCAEKIMSAVDIFTGNQEQLDDQTVVVITHKDAI